MTTIPSSTKSAVLSFGVSQTLSKEGKYPEVLHLTWNPVDDKKVPVMNITWHPVDGKTVPIPVPDFPRVAVSMDIAGHVDGADDRQYELYNKRGYAPRDFYLDYKTDENGYNVPTFATVAHPKFGTEGYVFHYRFKHPKTGKTSKWFKGSLRVITDPMAVWAMDAEAEQTMKAKKSAKK